MTAELEHLYDATENLVNQQFYKGSHDIIIGRSADVSVKIRSSGQIIKKFKTIFNQNMEIFLNGNYLNYLLLFKEIKGLSEDDIKRIHGELTSKLEMLKDADLDIITLYTIVISALISRIRDIHFNNSLDEIRKRAKQKSREISDKQIQDVLDILFMRNNNNVSILYNLSYIDALAESFNYKKAARICKIQKGKYINRIVKLILA